MALGGEGGFWGSESLAKICSRVARRITFLLYSGSRAGAGAERLVGDRAAKVKRSTGTFLILLPAREPELVMP